MLIRLLKEPLVHFLLLGAALFVVFELVGYDEAEPSDEQIIVSAGQIEHLTTTFVKTWQRPPTPEELKGLIDAYVEEEILSREAVKLGLHENDVVIRRRLKQKMDFLHEDFSATAVPSDEELAAYYDQHSERYRVAERFTFEHVYLSTERGEQLATDAAEMLVRLRSADGDTDVRELGDRLLLPSRFENEPWHSLTSQFGSQFSEQLNEIRQIDTWQGPVKSGYGLHLVRVRERTEGRKPELAEVRDAVMRDLMFERSQTIKQSMLEELREQYDVKIQWPTSSEVSNTSERP